MIILYIQVIKWIPLYCKFSCNLEYHCKSIFIHLFTKEFKVDVSIKNGAKCLGQILHVNIDANPLCVDLELS